MADGIIYEQADPEKFFTNPDTERAKKFLKMI
jgi:L-cystine transport system ATP-binding protein